MPRFVLLRHETPPDYVRPSHWDLMFEYGDRLRCWALGQALAAHEPQMADALPDHRLVYLDYEGSVSGDRGTVRRDDSGTFEVLAETDREFVTRLAGQSLRGTLHLERQNLDDHCWRISFTPD